MHEPFQPPTRSWANRFYEAGRGMWIALREGGSYTVHLLAAAAVLATGAFFQVTQTQWCLLVLCIALVFTAEIQNSGLEVLAKAVRQEYDPHVRNALDIASGAVLAASIGAVVVGLAIFLPYMWQLVF